MHPDTYAESYHRGFFANLQNGILADQCGAQTHDTPSMGALVTVAPLALALLPEHPVERVQEVCCTHVQLTHPDDNLLKVVSRYVALINELLQGRGWSLFHGVLYHRLVAKRVLPGGKVLRHAR